MRDTYGHFNRKPNGEILGLPIFLGKDVIEKFADSKTTHLEVTKTVTSEVFYLNLSL